MINMTSILPHHITSSLFLKVVLTNGKSDDAWAEEPCAEVQRKLLLTALKVIRSTDISWPEFQLNVKQSVPEDLLAAFGKEVTQIENLDQLMDVFQSFESLFDQRSNLLKKSSVLGLYIRKVNLDFKKLSFEDAANLWNSFQKYISPHCKKESVFNFTKSEDSLDESCLDESMAMDESTLEAEKENLATPFMVVSPSNVQVEEGNQSFSSRNKVIRFLSEQVKLLESNDKEGLTPNKLQQQLEEIYKLYPEIHEIYYLHFLNYLRVFEINAATVALQKFFDYKIFHEENNDLDLSVMEKHQIKFKRFRYCALNLGIMHCYHENYAQALTFFEEAIRVAQETNDQKCLNHAMFWLSIVKGETSLLQDGEDHLKQFIAETAKDLLKSEGNISTQVIDYLGVLRLIKIQTLKASQSPNKLLSTVSQLIISNQVISNTAQLVRSTMLQFYGLTKTAALMCQIPLQQVSLSNDTASGNHPTISEEDLVVSLCQLAWHLQREGAYDEINQLLSFAFKRLSLYSIHRKKLQLCDLLIRFKRSTSQRNLKESALLAKSISDIDEQEGALAMATVHVLMGNFSKAFKSLQSLLNMFDAPSNLQAVKPLLKVNASLLIIEILLLSSHPSKAESQILELLKFTDSKYMMNSQLDVNICLIRFLLMFNFADKAEPLINNLMLNALTNGSCFQQGNLFYLHAKCLTQRCNGLLEKEKKSNLLQAVSWLNKSLQNFKKGSYKARLRDVYYEQALVYHQLEYLQERNKSSTQYRLLHEEIKDFPNVVMF